MPSVMRSDDAILAGKKERKKQKIKNQALIDASENDASTGKKSKKSSKLSDSEDNDNGFSKVKKKEKESNKRKASDFVTLMDGDEYNSETSSELVVPENLKDDKKKNKKTKLGEVELEEDEEVEKVEDPNAVTNFRISEPLRAKLKEKGIESLFPIQAMTFDTILNGSDLVGRAQTGQVKL